MQGCQRLEVREMVKALLADRFQLVYLQETRELRIAYALIPAKGGDCFEGEGQREAAWDWRNCLHGQRLDSRE